MKRSLSQRDTLLGWAILAAFCGNAAAQSDPALMAAPPESSAEPVASARNPDPRRPLVSPEVIRTGVTVIEQVTPPVSRQATTPRLSKPPDKQNQPEPDQEQKKAQLAQDAPLINQLLGLDDSPIRIFGWIQNSFTGNPSQPSDGMNFGVNPNRLANRWMGNQYYLVVEKKVEQNDTVNFGFRVDNLFGNDWQFNHMHGLFDTSFQKNHFAGYDPAQMYLEAHLPVLTRKGLDIRGGRFYSIAGYEGVPAVSRPLLSVPYMFNYGQPFTFFGVLSTLYLGDNIKLFNGTVNGWDRWIDETYKWGYLGGLTWSSKSKKTGVAFTLVWGPNQFPRFLPANTEIVPTGATMPPFLAGRRNLGYGGNNRTLFTTVVTHRWTDRFTEIVETDEAFENNVPGLGPGGTQQNASWYGLCNWFLYQFGDSDTLTGVWRAEVFRDNNGIRTGFADNFYETTLGLIYKPRDWLWIRPEARYDWAQQTHPYNGGHSGSQFTMAFDVIVLF